MAKLIGAAALLLLGIVLLAGAFVGDSSESGAEENTAVTTERVADDHGSCCEKDTAANQSAESCCGDEDEASRTEDDCCGAETQPKKSADAGSDCCAGPEA